MNVIRRDFRSVLTVAAIVLMVALAFPYASLDFRARPLEKRRASCAFVTLSAAEEAEALRTAKMAWQVGSPSVRRRIALIPGDLPEDPHGPAAPSPETGLREITDVFRLEPAAYPATRGAPSPERIAAEPPAVRVLPFSREELLKIE